MLYLFKTEPVKQLVLCVPPATGLLDVELQAKKCLGEKVKCDEALQEDRKLFDLLQA